MIWFKLKHLKAKNATVYTTDPKIAADFDMVSKKKGRFYYRIISAKHLRNALGYTTRRYSQYMNMVHKYPPASEYIKRREKIPLEIKADMEAFMEWNPDTKTFNQDKKYGV
jgi:hypothetical protein